MRELWGGLTTRGRCLLAAGVAAAACGIVISERDLLRVAAFLVALPLLSAAVTRATRVGLSATRELLPARVAAGGATEVALCLRGGGAVSFTGITLTDTVGPTLGRAPRLLVRRVHRGATGRAHYPLRPTLRGSHPVGPLRARIGDPFGLAEFDRRLLGTDLLTVVPRHEPLTGPPAGTGTAVGGVERAGARAGQGEFDALVREYRDGDDPRRVHWASTARRDELMTRSEERPWRAGATLLLDTRHAAHRGAGASSSFEWAVSLTASLGVHLARQGHTVRLIGADATTLVDTARLGESAGGADAVLDALAVVTTTTAPITPLAPGLPGDTVIAVFGALDGVAVPRPGGRRGVAVLLDVNAWGGPGVDPDDSTAALRAAGWRVTTAGPGDPMAAVWGRVCAA